jgi:leucyl-tRNA synthetase
LLYARFWHRFLYDIGLVPTKEPFSIRTAHGMVLGENGEKMSKSRGNVINPNDIVEEFGADSLRLYEMFMGDYELDTSWSTNGLKGCKRFLDKVWRIQERVVAGNEYSKSLETSIHKTIKKVSNDIENMKYNTAVSSLMTLLNEFERNENITSADLRTFLILLNPMAPHITEEINELNNLGEMLSSSKWPEYDEAKTVDEEYEMIIQVNGKLRGRIIVSKNIDEEEMKNIALKNDGAERYIEGKEIVKIITVPNKLVNIVVK